MPASDYDWVKTPPLDLDWLTGVRYHFVLATPASEETVLAALGVTGTSRHSFEELPEALLPVGSRSGIAVSSCSPGVALAVDPEGHLLTSDPPTPPVTTDGLVVSLYRSINYDTQFQWFEGGRLQLAFGFSTVGWYRKGEQAEASGAMLTEVGFDLQDAPDDDDLMDQVMAHNDERLAFALAERLVGEKLTPDLLAAGTYTFAAMPSRAVPPNGQGAT
jgi:hypothetical protein